MNILDIIFVVFYVISAILWTTYGVRYIKQATDREKVSEGCLIILMGLTPASLIVDGVFLILGFICLIMEGPGWVVWRIKCRLNKKL